MSRSSSVVAIVAGLVLGFAFSNSAVAGPSGSIGDGLAITRNAGGTMLTVIDPTRDATALEFALFGLSTDKIISGDWDGDGNASLGIFRDAGGTGLWILDYTGNGVLTYELFGLSTDTPVPGDWDTSTPGDELGVTRAAGGSLLWIVQDSSGPGGLVYGLFGLSTDVPVPGNWDGDAGNGDNPGVTRAEGGSKLWITEGSGGFDYGLWGASTDEAIAGDYTGDQNTDYGVRVAGSNLFVLDGSTIEYTLLGDSTDGIFNPGDIGQ